MVHLREFYFYFIFLKFEFPFILWSNVDLLMAATERCVESDRWVDRHQTPGRRPAEACVGAKAPTSLPR